MENQKLYRLQKVPKKEIKLAWKKRLFSNHRTAPGCNVNIDVSIPEMHLQYEPTTWFRVGTGDGWCLVRFETPGQMILFIQDIMEKLISSYEEMKNVHKEQADLKAVSQMIMDSAAEELESIKDLENVVTIDVKKDKSNMEKETNDVQGKRGA